MRILKISGTGAAVARSNLGPRRGSTCPPSPTPRAGAPDFPSSKPGFSPGLLFCVLRIYLDARKRAPGSGSVRGNLLVAVGASHPTPDIEANPKEEGAGADQRGDPYGEDRLLHDDINLNGATQFPLAHGRDRGSGLVRPTPAYRRFNMAICIARRSSYILWDHDRNTHQRPYSRRSEGREGP